MEISEFIEKPVSDCFDKMIHSQGIRDVVASAQKMADFFLLSDSFGKLMSGDENVRSEAEKKHLVSFFGNLNLLVEKTWVEKVDEVQKQMVLNSLELYKENFSKKMYRKCYPHFFSIINGVMSLMFGQQCVKEGFLGYAMRIDPEIGLFWWYVCSLPRDEAEIADWDDEKIRAVLLVPMFFLANY